MPCRHSAIALLIGVMVGLTATAMASPPDPSRLDGFWDNADFDGVVLLITEMGSIGKRDPLLLASTILPVVRTTRPASDARAPEHVASTAHSRAPPRVS